MDIFDVSGDLNAINAKLKVKNNAISGYNEFRARESWDKSCLNLE